jgi:hypothetical protein
MKTNILKTAAILLFLAGSFSSCENNEMDIGTQYYWSGGQRIWLDTDYSVIIVRFDNEQNLNEYLSLNSTAFMLRPLIAVDWRESEIDRETFRKLEANETVISVAFGNRLHNTEVPIIITGEILFEPKTGVSVESILQKFARDSEVTHNGFWVSVEINDLNTIFDVANAIYRSGMVEWSHPDFLTIISR